MRQTLKSCVTIPARLESNSQESLSRRHCSQKSRWTVWRHARKPTKPELAHDLSPANSLQAPASCAHVSQWSCGYNTDVSLCFLSWQDQRRCRACLVHSHPGDLLQKANLSLGGDGLGKNSGTGFQNSCGSSPGPCSHQDSKSQVAVLPSVLTFCVTPRMGRGPLTSAVHDSLESCAFPKTHFIK